MMSYHVTHNQVWISRRTVCLQLIGTQVKIYFLNIKKKIRCVMAMPGLVVICQWNRNQSLCQPDKTEI